MEQSVSRVSESGRVQRGLSRAQILDALPQQWPFRFIDRIVSVDDEGIVGQYQFRVDEYFYQGHFPGDPITPGVILTETLGQTGLVAFGLHLVSRLDAIDISKVRTVFTEANVEFLGTVRPGDRVTIEAKKIFFRRLKLKVRAQMRLDDGEIVCAGELAGIGVQVP